MNLLSLVSSLLDKFYQIITKSATETFPQKFLDLNTPLLRVRDMRVRTEAKKPNQVVFASSLFFLHINFLLCVYDCWTT
jgi:hypothetical protein